MTSIKDFSNQKPTIDAALFSLIEKTYAVAINPEKYTEFISALDLFLESNSSDAPYHPPNDAKAISRHFIQANEILDQKSDSSDLDYLFWNQCPIQPGFATEWVKYPILMKKQ